MSSDRSDKGPKGRDAIDEIARRLGSIVETVQDAIKTGGATGDGGRDFKIDTPLGPLSGRYSMNVKSAIGGSRTGQPAPARRKPVEEPAANPTAREPMIDAFDEPDAVVVTADIPGLRLEDVFISCEPGELVLKISGAAPFTKRLAFPMLTPDHSPRVRMANGILEIRVNKDLAS
jgi:HSP20 family protein